MLNKYKNIAVLCGEYQLPILILEKILKFQTSINKILIIKFTNYNYDNLNNFFIINPDFKNKCTFKTVDFPDIFTILSHIEKLHINNIIMCGKVRFKGLNVVQLFLKNKLQNIKYILNIIPIIIKMLININHGDDFLLKLVEKILYKHNINLLSVQDIIPNILAQNSDKRFMQQNIIKNSNKYKIDIDLGFKILYNISNLDIGQSIVIQNQRVLGIEAAEGTSELINRCAKYQIKNINKKSILIKTIKTNQSKKLDMPTIGIETIKDLINNNYAGIAVQDNSIIMLDKDEIFNIVAKNNDFFIYLYNNN